MAELLGLTEGLDAATWKRERDGVRDQMKILCLYGMGPRSIGLALGRHPLVGAAIRDRFAWRCAKFWAGRDAVVDRLRHLGVIYAADGWPLKISYAPNEKSILNFPCQSGGAVMLRKAVVDLCRADIVPIMTVHDGLLFEEADPAKIMDTAERDKPQCRARFRFYFERPGGFIFRPWIGRWRGRGAWSPHAVVQTHQTTNRFS